MYASGDTLIAWERSASRQMWAKDCLCQLTDCGGKDEQTPISSHQVPDAVPCAPVSMEFQPVTRLTVQPNGPGVQISPQASDLMTPYIVHVPDPESNSKDD